MATFLRGVRPLIRQDFVCTRCLQFSTSVAAQSGHNRWSKIKHDKGSADAKKNVQRSIFAHEIALCSRLYGGDPGSNSKLAALVAIAKKAGFPKASIEAAVARGQGRSTSGAALESLTLEAILPPSIGIVVDIETENKGSTLPDVRYIIKSKGGTVTPTAYLFERRGRTIFEKDGRDLGEDEVLDQAIEAGAEDVETDKDGNIVVWTEPSQTSAAANSLQQSLDMKVLSSDLIWDPKKDTMVTLETEDQAMALAEMINGLKENPTVQAVYANVVQGNIPDEVWAEVDVD